VPSGSGPLSRCTITGATGAYMLTSLGSGDYDVFFLDLGGEYMTQYYDEASSLGSASSLIVEAGSSRSGINAALRQGVPVNLTVPKISGSAVEAQTLKVIHGSWTNAPTSYRDEWGLCTNATEITSCRTVALGESFTLSAAEGGDAIRVRELASNPSGESAFAYSAPTAVVTRPPAGGVPAAPVPVESAGGGVAGYEIAVPAQVPDAKLASTALVASSSGAVSIKVSCPAAESRCAGRVTLRTLSAVIAAAGSAAKTKTSILTLATGSFNVAGGKVETVTLHLTAKARKLLAGSHVLRARATIVAHDPSGATHTTQTTVTLRAPKVGHGKG